VAEIDAKLHAVISSVHGLAMTVLCVRFIACLYSGTEGRVWDKIELRLLTLRRLMSYIYGASILDVSRSHTTTQHSR